MNPLPAFYHILILKADLLCASILEQAVRQLFPIAKIQVVNSLKGARAELDSQPADLLLAGIVLPDGDSLDLLGEELNATGRNRRTLVVTSRREHQILATLRALPIHGVFDPSREGLEELRTAIRIVAGGDCYWSSGVIKRSGKPAVPSDPIGRMLSRTEELVFAVIGDGCDDNAAADQLQMKPSTVHSVRRDLHRKLGVQHRGELIRLAVVHGYVRFTAQGVQRPGFSGLLAARAKRNLNRVAVA